MFEASAICGVISEANLGPIFAKNSLNLSQITCLSVKVLDPMIILSSIFLFLLDLQNISDMICHVFSFVLIISEEFLIIFQFGLPYCTF